MAKTRKVKQTLHMMLAETHNRLFIQKERLEHFDDDTARTVANHLADTMYFIDSLFKIADAMDKTIEDERIDQDDIPF